ncbi:hydroquinone glucosyltransferase [Phtheirospermum japonicum]|uniref:Glycosyltransferase n=1 Tax=Phtheirospermum japonicum TaxID=374723 RepID=A0A830BH76_9LAMI|nr:hydroquinone glucosyltransferase [Phtheirospermum japonicum]
MGHLIPLIELARKLLDLHTNLTITFIIPDDGLPTKPQKSLLHSFPAINSIFLPPSINEPLPDSKIETRIVLSVIRSIPSLLAALHDLNRSTRLSAFVADLFGSHTFHAVKGLGIPLYLFFTSSAMVLSFSFYLSELDESCACEYRDLPEPVKVPGCVPVRGSDLPDPVQDRESQAYRGSVEMCKQFGSAEGILVNTFLDLEPGTFKSFGMGNSPPVYPVGPLIRTGSATESGGECLKWLDKQPDRSVLFISFGSGGTLSRQQLNELAAGLEMSRQRFLLVAKSPNDEIKNAAYFTGADDEIKMDDHSEYVSADFLERTKERGYVISQWAPQIEVLSHVAVGGFVTHCGWNSTLESIVQGVPLIAWPLFAEQRMNAVLLSEGLKVAIRVRENENGVVEREQISELARRLMEGEEGEELRKRMRGFKDAAAKALSQYGSSTRALANVAGKWIGLE